MYGFWADFKRCSAAKETDFQLLLRRLNSVIDIIHSTENKAIKKGMKSVNSTDKSSHVACNFAAICRDDFRKSSGIRNPESQVILPIHKVKPILNIHKS